MRLGDSFIDSAFQSTPSVWRETAPGECMRNAGNIFQSTPSVWRETCIYAILHRCFEFQSTPSVWRETDKRITFFASSFNFNPLPPYGGRQAFQKFICLYQHISIHSLRMEGDYFRRSISALCRRFQSTPSVWRETTIFGVPMFSPSHFNPLPPYGGRLPLISAEFTRIKISIHSLRMEGDGRSHPANGEPASFQSTPSVWRETTGTTRNRRRNWNFNPLPPYGGRLRY